LELFRLCTVLEKSTLSLRLAAHMKLSPRLGAWAKLASRLAALTEMSTRSTGQAELSPCESAWAKLRYRRRSHHRPRHRCRSTVCCSLLRRSLCGSARVSAPCTARAVLGTSACVGAAWENISTRWLSRRSAALATLSSHNERGYGPTWKEREREMLSTLSKKRTRR